MFNINNNKAYVCLHIYSAANVLAGIKQLLCVYQNRTPLSAIVNVLFFSSCYNWEGYTYVVKCICVQAGLPPGLLFTVITSWNEIVIYFMTVEYQDVFLSWRKICSSRMYETYLIQLFHSQDVMKTNLPFKCTSFHTAQQSLSSKVAPAATLRHLSHGRWLPGLDKFWQFELSATKCFCINCPIPDHS